MTASLGKREANKKATREALQAAASRLFAERGAAATKVRDIAEAAGVTERTFFRYFVSKQDLMINSELPWMHPFQEAIRRRPPDEPPLTAIHSVLAMFLPFLTSADSASPAALYAEGPPALGVSTGSRALMLRIESDLADVIGERLLADPTRSDTETDVRFEAEVLGRTAFGLFRSVMLRDAELRATGIVDRPDIATLFAQAFRVDLR